MISIVDLFTILSLKDIGEQTVRRLIGSNLTIDDLTSHNNASLEEIFHNKKSLHSFIENFQNERINAEKALNELENEGVSVIHYYHWTLNSRFIQRFQDRKFSFYHALAAVMPNKQKDQVFVS